MTCPRSRIQAPHVSMHVQLPIVCCPGWLLCIYASDGSIHCRHQVIKRNTGGTGTGGLSTCITYLEDTLGVCVRLWRLASTCTQSTFSRLPFGCNGALCWRAMQAGLLHSAVVCCYLALIELTNVLVALWWTPELAQQGSHRTAWSAGCHWPLLCLWTPVGDAGSG
jgi:hypothetical protein